MRICPAHTVISIEGKPGDCFDWTGYNPNIEVVPFGQADFIWYATIGDGDSICRNLKALEQFGKPLISVVLSALDYRPCLSPENRLRHFSSAIDDWPMSVPCFYCRRSTVPTVIRPLLASFCGSFSTNPNRRLLLKVAAKDIIIDRYEWWQKSEAEHDKARPRYDYLLFASRFTLCPRGLAARSTMRLPDAILAGSLPVLIDDWSRPFDNDLAFAVRTSFKELPKAIDFIRAMPESEYRERLADMERFAQNYLLADLKAGCNGTLGYTELIRKKVESL